MLANIFEIGKVKGIDFPKVIYSYFMYAYPVD